MYNELIIKVFILVFFVLLYTAWRKYAAYKGRQKMTDLLDDFLSGDPPEEMKEFSFQLFYVSLFGLFSPIALWNIIFSTPKNNNKKGHSHLKNATDQQKNQFISLIGLGAIVIFKRAPITTFICLIILLAVIIFRALIDKLTYQDSILTVENSLNKTAKHYI